MPCLFCQADGPYTVEHIIPESLGNNDMVLVNDVCKSCNNHFSKIEEFVLHKTPLAFWRTYLGIRTKSGTLPSVNLSQPAREKGTFAAIHSTHDNNVGFTAHEDSSTSIEIDNSDIVNEILLGEKTQLQFVFTPLLLFMLGRFLCKVGVELLCFKDPAYARSDKFLASRNFARRGSSRDLWPIFHFSYGKPNDFKRVSVDARNAVVESDYYSYKIFEITAKFIFLQFSVGTDNWIICLSDKYPTPDFFMAFPGQNLKCIWYPPGP